MSNPVDIKEVNGFWQCQICRQQFDEGTDRTVYIIDSTTICQKCYNRGQIWAIREAYKELFHGRRNV